MKFLLNLVFYEFQNPNIKPGPGYNTKCPYLLNIFKTQNHQKAPLNKKDTLTELINLQTANGSFKYGKAIQDLIGMTENQIIEKIQESEADGVWITAVALAILEKKFPEDKELWELIAKKAKTFIKSNGKSNFDEIMKKVATVLV